MLGGPSSPSGLDPISVMLAEFDNICNLQPLVTPAAPLQTGKTFYFMGLFIGKEVNFSST